MMQIDLSTQVAETAVDRLGKKIEGLADVAQRTGKRMGDGLNFAASVKKTFADLKTEHKALQNSLQEIQKAFQASNGAMGSQVAAGAALRDMSKMVSKAMLSQTTAVRDQTRELKSMVTATNSTVAAKAKARTAAEQYLTTLTRTNQESFKTTEQLAKMRAGWGALGVAEQQETKHQIKLQEAIKGTSSLMKEQLTTAQRYKQQLSQLSMLRMEKQNNPEQNIGISEKQYQIALKNLNSWLKKTTEEEQKRANAMTKTEVAVKKVTLAEYQRNKAMRETTAGTNDALAYLNSLARTNAMIGKTTSELATLRSGWTQLSGSQRTATQHQISLAEAFRATSSLLKQQLTPLQQYEKQLAHLELLRKEFGRTKGRMGVGEEQYAIALKNLKRNFQEVQAAESAAIINRSKSVGATRKATDAELNHAASLRKLQNEAVKLDKIARSAATGGLRSLNSEYHVGAQAAAAFRAAMHGANLGFGIFTSSTILTATAVYGLTKGLSESLRVGAEFQRSFQRAAVMMKTFEEVADGSANAMTGQTKAVRRLVLDLAETTQYTAVQVADAASVLALSGQEAHEIYSNLGSVLDLASVGMMDMSRAADIATGMMASFGMSGKDFEKSVDIIAATASKTKASVEDIGMAMTYIGPIAKQAGSSIEEVSAAMGILAENNIRGSKAGTALRRMFTNLLSPTAAGKKAFKELNIDIAAMVEGGVDLVEVFQALANAGADIGDLKNIFGQYALTSAAALQANVANFRALNIQMNTQVKGFAASTRDALTQNFQLAVEELKNVIQRGMIAAFDQFGPGLEKDIRALADTLRGETGNIANIIGEVAGAIIRAAKSIIDNFHLIRKTSAPLFKALNTALQFTADNFGVLASLFVGFTAYKIVHSVLTLITKGLMGAAAAAGAYELRQRGLNIVARDYGSVFAPEYINAVNQKRVALAKLPAAMKSVQMAQAALSTQVGAFARMPATPLMMRPSLISAGQAAAAAAAPMGIFARSIAGIGTAARGALSIFGGLPGVLLTIASVAIPMMVSGMGEAEAATRSLSGAVETLAAFEGRIAEMSDRVRLQLTKDLRTDLETAKAQVEALKKELLQPSRRKGQLEEIIKVGENARASGIKGWEIDRRVRAEGKARKELAEILAIEIALKEDLAIAEAQLAEVQSAFDKNEALNKESLLGPEKEWHDLLHISNAATLQGVIAAAKFSDANNEVATALENGTQASEEAKRVTAAFGKETTSASGMVDQFLNPVVELTDGFKELKAELASFLEAVMAFVAASPLANLIPDSVLISLEKFVGLLRAGPIKNTSWFAGDSLSPSDDFGFGPGTFRSSTFLSPNQGVNGITDSESDTEETKEQAAALREATTELRKYFEAYEKGTGSVEGIKRELAEINKAQADIASRSPAAINALKEMGYSAQEGLKALDWSEANTTFEFVTQQLAKMDPRFKDLTLSMSEAKLEELDQAAAMAEVERILSSLGKSTEWVTEMMERFAPALARVNDPTIKLREEFAKLQEESNNLMATWNSPSTFDGMRKKFEGLGKNNSDFVLATIRASKVFGDFQDTMGETQQLEEAAKLLDILVKGNGDIALSADVAARAMKKFYDSTPLGKLQEENRQLQIRMNNITRSAEDQYVLNAALAEYGSTLEGMPKDFETAARAAYQMNQEFERINAIRDAYKQFGDGVLRTFTGLIDGTTQNFDDAMDRIKDMFKQLLAELVYMAAKNAIVMTFTGQGSASGGGGFNWGSVISGIFGGGNTQGGGGTSTAGGGGAGWMSGITGMMTALGFGQQGTTSGGAIASVLGSYGVNASNTSTASGGGSGGLLSGATTWVQAGRQLWNGFTGSAAASGVPASQMTTMFGTYTPTNFVGPVSASGGGAGFAPSALGYAGAGLAAAGMAYTGYQMHQGQSGGTRAGAALSYGALGWGAAMTGMAMASGATFGAAAAGAFGSAAGASMAIPIVGWVLAAIALVDYATGGRIMGTDYRPEKYNTTVGIRDQAAFAGASIQEWRYTNANPFRDFGNWGLGQRRSRTRNIDPPDELEAAAEKFYDMQLDVAKQAARRFRNEVGPLIEGTFTQVMAFTDKGKRDEKKDTAFAEILGKKYEDITMEEFTKRMSGFQILSQIANNLTAEQIGAGGFNWSAGGSTGGARPGGRTDVGDEIFEDLENSEQLAEVASGWQESFNQIMSIAARWESNADDFAAGAEFLLNAAVDMAHGIGLLGEEGTLAEITDLIEAVQMGEESLSETYRRVVQSVYLVESSLGGFNVTAGRTREEFVMFSEEMVSALGGVDAASTALQTFSNAFGQLEVIAQYQADQAWSARTRSLERIGLDPNTTAEQFIAAFADRLPELSGAEAADWIVAGQGLANVALALRSMREQLSGGESLAAQLDRQVQQVASIGGSPADVAEARMIADQILANALSEFMRQVRSDLAAFEGDEYAFKISEINRAMTDSITQATMLGASEDDLNMIRRRAQHQIDAIAKELGDFMFGIEGQIAAIEGHPVQHHLKEIARQMEANIRQARGLGASEQQLARIRRLAAYQMTAAINELKNSIRSLVGQFYDSDGEGTDLAAEAQSQYESQRAAAESLYEQEMQRYEDAQEAIKNIAKFLTDLEIGELSPGSWQDRLGAARTNFMDLFQRAMGGDSDALSEITGAAQQFLQLGSEFYGSTTGYAEIYNLVTSMLRQLNVSLGTITEPSPLPPDPGGDSGSGSGSSESERDRIQREAERFQLALQIAQQIGDLGLAMNVSVYDLMEEFGVKLGDLASALGIDIRALNRDTTAQLQILSGALGVSFIEVADRLGISITALAGAFGLNIEEFSAATMGLLAEFSSAVGISITDMAEMLNISVTSFTTALIDSLSSSLSSLPDLPAEIRAGLQPFLDSIAGADTFEGVRTAISALTAFIATLPEDQREALRPVMEGVGLTIGDAVGQTQVEVMAQVKTAVDSVREAQAGHTVMMISSNAQMTGGLYSISSAIGGLADIMAAVRDNIGGTGGDGGGKGPEPEGTGSYGSLTGGSYTPAQEDETVVAAYAAATSAQELQAETLEKTQAMLEQLEALNVTVSEKLDQVNSTQVEGNLDRKSIKTTTRLQGIENATRTKRGRSK